MRSISICRSGARVLGFCLVAACGGATSGASTGDTLSETAWREPVRVPRARDLVVQTTAPTPVGRVSAMQAPNYRIEIALTNTSPDPVETWAVWFRTSVYRDGAPVPGCVAPARRVSDAPLALGPGGAIVVATVLPCALREPGTYEIIANVDVDDPAQPGLSPLLVAEGSSAQSIVVDATLPPFEGAMTNTE